MFQVLVFVSVDFFSLQCLDEAFATGVVIGVRRSAHARNHVVFLEEGDVFPASVLQPSIRVMHEAGFRLSALGGLFQRSDSEPHPEGTIQRPAHHFISGIDPDPTWVPWLDFFPTGTPAHPEYPSGHSTASGAAAFILATAFGENTAFTVTSDVRPGTRSFASFSAATSEIADTRVFGGIHY